MTERTNEWEAFAGRVFGSRIDREIGRAIADQGVEQHTSFRGRLRREVGGRTVRTEVTTQTPGEGPKTWAVHKVSTKPDGSTERGKLIAEVQDSHTLAELTAAHYLTGLRAEGEAGDGTGTPNDDGGDGIERRTLRHRGYLAQELLGLPQPTWFIFNDRERKVGMMRIDHDRLRTTLTPTGYEVCSGKVPMLDWSKEGYAKIENEMRASIDLLDCNVPAAR